MFWNWLDREKLLRILTILKLLEIAIISSRCTVIKIQTSYFEYAKNTRYNKDKYNSHVGTKRFLIAYLAEYRIFSKSNSIACPL